MKTIIAYVVQFRNKSTRRWVKYLSHYHRSKAMKQLRECGAQQGGDTYEWRLVKAVTTYKVIK